MGNQIFGFFPFWAFLAQQQSIFQKSQPFLLFEILVSSLFHTLREKNYQKKV